jgi:hypothetical protein
LNEPEAVREELSNLMKAPFEIVEPRSDNSILKIAKPRWFVTCPNATFHSKTVHAHSSWADDGGNIWLESSILTFVSEWIELDYGEEGFAPFRKIEPHDLTSPLFREQLAKEFPVTMKRIERFESIASEVSLRRKVRLRMRYDNSIGSIGMYLEAQIESNDMDLQSKLKAIGTNVRAMKEAYEEFLEVDRRSA